MRLLTVLLLSTSVVAVGLLGFGRQGPDSGGAIAAESDQEEEPAVREVAPGEYEVVLRANTWGFDPGEIRVPLGSQVTFRVTADDPHGFGIAETGIAIWVDPGSETVASHRFTEPGQFFYYCTRYCGSSHYMMLGKIIVEQ